MSYLAVQGVLIISTLVQQYYNSGSNNIYVLCMVIVTVYICLIYYRLIYSSSNMNISLLVSQLVFGCWLAGWRDEGSIATE